MKSKAKAKPKKKSSDGGPQNEVKPPSAARALLFDGAECGSQDLRALTQSWASQAVRELGEMLERLTAVSGVLVIQFPCAKSLVKDAHAAFVAALAERGVPEGRVLSICSWHKASYREDRMYEVRNRELGKGLVAVVTDEPDDDDGMEKLLRGVIPDSDGCVAAALRFVQPDQAGAVAAWFRKEEAVRPATKCSFVMGIWPRGPLAALVGKEQGSAACAEMAEELRRGFQGAGASGEVLEAIEASLLSGGSAATGPARVGGSDAGAAEIGQPAQQTQSSSSVCPPVPPTDKVAGGAPQKQIRKKNKKPAEPLAAPSAVVLNAPDDVDPKDLRALIVRWASCMIAEMKGRLDALTKVSGVLVIQFPCAKSLVKEAQAAFAAALGELEGLAEERLLSICSWHRESYREDRAYEVSNRQLGKGLVAVVTDEPGDDGGLEKLLEALLPEGDGRPGLVLRFVQPDSISGVAAWFQKESASWSSVMGIWPRTSFEALVGKEHSVKGYSELVQELSSGFRSAGAQAQVQEAMEALASRAAELAADFEAGVRDRLDEEAMNLTDLSVASFLQRHPAPTCLDDIQFRFLPSAGTSSWAGTRRFELARRVRCALIHMQAQGHIEGQWRREAASKEHTEKHAAQADSFNDEAWIQELQALSLRAKDWKDWETAGDLHMKEMAWNLFDKCIAGSEVVSLAAGEVLQLVETWPHKLGESFAYRVAPSAAATRPGPSAGDILCAFALSEPLAAQLLELPEPRRPWPLRATGQTEEEPGSAMQWFLFNDAAQHALAFAKERGEKVVLRYLTKPGYWHALELSNHALSKVAETHRRMQSGFSSAANWTGIMNLVTDMLGCYDRRTSTIGEWADTYGSLLPQRLDVVYGMGKVFAEDQHWKGKMEANILEACVGELLASGREECVAAAELIGGLAAVTCMYPPSNLAPSNHHMMYQYEAKSCEAKPGYLQFDFQEIGEWVERRLEMLPSDEDIEDPGVPGAPQGDLDGPPPAHWGRADFYERQEDGEWRCLLCSCRSTDDHVAGAKHVNYSAYPEDTIQLFLAKGRGAGTEEEGAAISTATPPERWGRPELFGRGADGEWQCMLCRKQASDEHIASKAHQKWVGYPEEDIRRFLRVAAEEASRAATPASSTAEALALPEPAAKEEGSGTAGPPKSWGRSDFYARRSDGEWQCKLCGKQASDEHVKSKSHTKNATFPEEHIQQYLRAAEEELRRSAVAVAAPSTASAAQSTKACARREAAPTTAAAAAVGSSSAAGPAERRAEAEQPATLGEAASGAGLGGAVGQSVGPPEHWGRADFYELRGGEWFCKLCKKQCSDDHIASKAHKKYVTYPEEAIQAYLRA